MSAAVPSFPSFYRWTTHAPPNGPGGRSGRSARDLLRRVLQIGRDGPGRGDGDRLRLLAELLVPVLERVGAGRNAGDLEIARGVGQGVVGVARHDDPAGHPGVHVALDLDDVRFLEG